MSEDTELNDIPQSSGAVVKNTNAPVGSKDVQNKFKAKEEPAKVAPQISTSAKSLIDQLKALSDSAALNVIDGIAQYMQNMAPGKVINPVDGARQQVILYRTLQNAINGTQRNFRLLFATILKIVDENSKGAFSGAYVFRFTDAVVLNTEDRQGFLRIMNLILTAAAVEGRQIAVRHVDFTRSLQYGVTEEGRVRVLSFFNH